MRPELEQLICRGGVNMDTREADAAGLTSLIRIQTIDVAIHMISGNVTGGWPGAVEDVGGVAGPRSPACPAPPVRRPLHAIRPPRPPMN